MKPASERDPTLVSSSQRGLNLKQELRPLTHVSALFGSGAASVIEVQIILWDELRFVYLSEYSGFGSFSQTNMSVK